MAKFPGLLANMVLDLTKEYYATTTMSSRIVHKRGSGAIVTDIDDNKFIDLHCDAGVNNLGHCHPELGEVSRAQELILVFAEYHNAPNYWAASLARELALKSPVERLGGRYPKVFFSNSGAEANEAARKLCRAYRIYKTNEPKRTKAIYFSNGFAGRTKGVLSASSSKPEMQRDPFWDHCDKHNSIYLPYPQENYDWNAFKKEFDQIDLRKVDRILMEIPCQGEGGIIPVDESALKYIYQKAKNAGIIFISDCVQTGMGRVGTLFGCDIFSWFHPDILVMGKALGGGNPIGATIFRNDLDWPFSGMHANTFGGGPRVACVARVAISETQKLLKSGRVLKIEEFLDKNLRTLYNYRFVEDVRGKGAMWAVEFSTPAVKDAVLQAGEQLAESEEYGLKLLGAGRKSVRIMPPLVITDQELNLAITLFDKVCRSLA